MNNAVCARMQRNWNTHIVDGHIECYRLFGKDFTISHKIIQPPCDPAGCTPKSLLDKYPREMKIYTHKDFYTNVEGNFIYNSPKGNNPDVHEEAVHK